MNSLQLNCAAVPPAAQAPDRSGSPPVYAIRRIQFDRHGRARDQVSAITKAPNTYRVDGVNLRIGIVTLPKLKLALGGPIKASEGFLCHPSLFQQAGGDVVQHFHNVVAPRSIKPGARHHVFSFS